MPRPGVALFAFMAAATLGWAARAERLWEKGRIDLHGINDYSSHIQMTGHENFPKDKIDEKAAAPAKPPAIRPYPLQLPFPLEVGNEIVGNGQPAPDVIDKQPPMASTEAKTIQRRAQRRYSPIDFLSSLPRNHPSRPSATSRARPWAGTVRRRCRLRPSPSASPMTETIGARACCSIRDMCSPPGIAPVASLRPTGS